MEENLPPEAEKRFASVFMSRDGNWITLNDFINRKIVVISRI